MIYNSEFPIDQIKRDKKLIFLAGSIDLDLPGNWRESVATRLESRYDFFDPTTLNHKTLTELQWEDHIKWELEAMEMADIILMNLLEIAKSPISLVELGLNSRSNKIVVVCPEKFYKQQYITTLCNYYSTPLFKELKSAVNHIQNVFA